MSSGDAKSYLSRRNVPALFECLMTGLMFHRPTDHIQYLIDCLEKAKVKGQDELRWNMFIEMQRSKTPLPPITPTNGRRPISRERSMTPREERPPEPRAATPLPPISDAKPVPDVPTILMMGGPGSCKSTHADALVQKQEGWVTISVGQMLREEVAARSAVDPMWKMVKEIMVNGEMVPEDVVCTLLMNKLKASQKAEGFVIQGYPRDLEQTVQYNTMVCRVDAVILVDYEEDTLTKRLEQRAKEGKRIDDNASTVAKRLQIYGEKTLPMLKHYDDMDKLFILEGEKSTSDIAADLAAMFDMVINGKGKFSPAPPKDPKPEGSHSARSGRTTPKKASSPEPSAVSKAAETEAASLPLELMPPEVKIKDEGRRPDMPKAPIIFVAGGPGSGKGTQCKRLLERYTNAVHLSMGDILRTKITTEGTADAKWGMVTELLQKGDLAPKEIAVEVLSEALKEKPHAHFYLVEGFPRNLDQLEDFNEQIGGQGFTILLDCEEYTLHHRLSLRRKASERIDDNETAVENKLAFFKNNTLPILKTIEDGGKLVLVNGDRDEQEITYDLSKILDFAIYGSLPEVPVAAQGQDGVVEEAITPAKAATTGDNIANPSYTAELNALAPEIPAHMMPPEVKVKDEGRKSELPQSPIIFVAGAPGSGKGAQCKRLVSRYTDAVHLSMGNILRSKIMSEGDGDAKWGAVRDLVRQGELAPEEVTVELLSSALKEKTDAKFYLVEGFPRNLEQLEDFNKLIGGQSFTILLDCDESTLQQQISLRRKENERIDDNETAVANKLAYFKKNTLPILKTFEDCGKLVAVNGGRGEDEVHSDLCKVIDFTMYGKSAEAPANTEAADKTESKEPETEATGETAAKEETKETPAVENKEEETPAKQATEETAAAENKQEESPPTEGKEGETAATEGKEDETPAQETTEETPAQEAKEETPAQEAKEETPAQEATEETAATD